MSDNVKKVRALRKMGSQKLTKMRSDLTEMAWELTEKNQQVNDKNIAQTLVLIDRSLVECASASKS